MRQQNILILFTDKTTTLSEHETNGTIRYHACLYSDCFLLHAFAVDFFRVQIIEMAPPRFGCISRPNSCCAQRIDYIYDSSAFAHVYQVNFQ